jgi:uncharacterized membrane protein SpoIIM required for sporulation
MISTRWLERRTPHWTRLESLLDQAVRDGIGALTRGELRELSLLYRQTAADLSALREDPAGEGYARYLNQLLARAHNTIYAGRKSSAYDVLRFYRKDWPRVFRQTLPFTLTATALFAIGAVFGAVLTAVRPEFMHRLLGPHMVHTIESRKMWTDSVVSIRPVASSAIMTNNLSVSFMTFAAGMTAGLGTLYMLVFNGVLLGVIGTACWISGMSLGLWSFVAPHGVLELPAIFIAGGAGLMLAKGLLFPGVLSRRDSLVSSGALAVRLVLGIIPLLIIAGTIEGFLSPAKLPASLKLTFAAVVAALFAAWLLSSPTKADSAPSPPNTDSAAKSKAFGV